MRKESVSLLFIVLLFCLAACKGQTYYEDSYPSETKAMQRAQTAVSTQEPTQPSIETTAAVLPDPADEEFVRITDYIPTASQELFYATNRNFTGQIIYDFTDAYLRYGTVKKLMAVSRDLEEMGLYLKIWDGFRPISAQFKLWEVCPNPTYVANPNVGYSSHSRGNTVDLTLMDGQGKELEMPTGFDDFSAKADRDYSDCTEIQKNNAQILEIIMEKHGFTGYSGEWWHYSDTVSYPVEEGFDPSVS